MECIFKNENNRNQFISYSILTCINEYDMPDFEPHDDKHRYYDLPQRINHEYQDLPTSSLLFPSVMSCIKTGSRAENTYSQHSDDDFMYVIGPIKAKEKLEDLPPTIDPNLYVSWEPTEHDGFYYIKDRYNNYMYPQMLQMKLVAILNIDSTNKGISRFSPRKTFLNMELATPKTNVNVPAVKADNEDKVIAIALEAWPSDVWSNFATNTKLIWCKDLLSKFKGKNKVKDNQYPARHDVSTSECL